MAEWTFSCIVLGSFSLPRVCLAFIMNGRDSPTIEKTEYEGDGPPSTVRRLDVPRLALRLLTSD